MLRKIIYVILISGFAFLVACNSEKKQKTNDQEKTEVKKGEQKPVELKNPDNKPIVNKFLTFDEKCDATKLNVRLFLEFDKEQKAFTGFLQNTTSDTIKYVSVVIYMNNSQQLGPLSAIELFPNEKMSLSFAATYDQTVKWLPDLLFGE
jgi:hypothetical protein